MSILNNYLAEKAVLFTGTEKYIKIKNIKLESYISENTGRYDSDFLQYSNVRSKGEVY